MKDKKDIFCPNCKRNNIKIVFARADGENVYKCNNCDLRFVNYSGQNLDRFYKKSYFEGSDNLTVGYEDYDYRPTADFYWQAKLVKKLLPEGEGYLDVGCATGKTLEVSRMLGVKSAGVELSEYAAGIAREKGFDIYAGVLGDYRPRIKFGTISFWEVIEHVADPGSLLLIAKNLIKKRGWVLLSVPDATDKGPEWTGYRQSLEHVSYFTEKSLTFLLEKIFGSNNVLVKGYTDGVSSTLLGFAKIGTSNFGISDLGKLIDTNIVSTEDSDKLVKFSLLKGLCSPELADRYYEQQSLSRLIIPGPEGDIIDGLRVLLKHRMDEDTVTEYAKNLSRGKRSDSPFWECFVYSLSENYHFLRTKYDAQTSTMAEIKKERDATNATYSEVINSKGWRAVLCLRKFLGK